MAISLRKRALQNGNCQSSKVKNVVRFVEGKRTHYGYIAQEVKASLNRIETGDFGD
jgi:hypothetical protein